MAISLPDARELPNAILEALRLRALRGRELGFTEADLADLLGVTRETVSRWWVAYRSGGIDAIPGDRSGRPVGSGRLLSDEQARQIRDFIDHNSPENVGVHAPLWNRRAVRDLIGQKLGLRLPIRTVGEYLKRWGYTAKKPQRHARHQDPEEVDRWLKETYPDLARKAREEGATILWCDEVGVSADAFPGLGYARRGQRATLEVPKPHIRMNMISAVGNEGVVRFMTYAGGMTGSLFLRFLKRLLKAIRGKVYLIVDRLPAHDSELVRAWLSDHVERIEVVFLPTYAPERNADEYLNNDMKGQVKDEGLPENKAELRLLIQKFMHRLLHWPDHVINYFKHPCVQYAAAQPV